MCVCARAYKAIDEGNESCKKKIYLAESPIVFRIKCYSIRKVLPRRVTLGERNFQVASSFKNLYSPEFYYRDPHVSSENKTFQYRFLSSHSQYRWPTENFIIARVRESFLGNKTLD